MCVAVVWLCRWPAACVRPSPQRTCWPADQWQINGSLVVGLLDSWETTSPPDDAFLIHSPQLQRAPVDTPGGSTALPLVHRFRGKEGLVETPLLVQFPARKPMADLAARIRSRGT